MKVCVLFLIRILTQSLWEVVLKVTNLVATIANERRKEKRVPSKIPDPRTCLVAQPALTLSNSALCAGAAAADAAPPRLRSERSRPKG